MQEQRKKYFYYYDSHLQLHEVKWFRLKITGVIVALLLVSLSTILLVNHVYYDFLGLGYNRLNTLTKENGDLRDQLAQMTVRMKGLESAFTEMNDEANHVRLMVDLPAVDHATQTGGIGGAVSQPEYSASSDNTTQLLRSASTLLNRLGSEMKVQQQSYEEITKKIDYDKGYFAAMPALKPMEGYYSTNGFGLRMHPVLGIFKTHEGLDIVNDVGTSVVAAGGGTVEVAGQSGGGYGIVVVIKHGFGFQTLYAHLSKVLVREGQHVKRGDVIGRSGRTGLVTGPHLHYEVRYNGVCKNPVDYFLDDVTPQYYRSQIASR